MKSMDKNSESKNIQTIEQKDIVWYFVKQGTLFWIIKYSRLLTYESPYTANYTFNLSKVIEFPDHSEIHIQTIKIV